MKRAFSLLLALALLLTLAACGREEAPTEELPGEDWRTTGMVNDRGTIVQDGVETPVCVCIGSEWTTFYYDEAEQICFDSVTYPVEIPNAASDYWSISFDDVTGDGSSDIRLEFRQEDGTETVLVWYWEGEDCFQFQPDASYGPYASDSTQYLAAYVGLWEYVGQNFWIRIHEDGTWDILNSEETVLESGIATAGAAGVELGYEDSDDRLVLEYSPSGELLDPANGGVLQQVSAIVLRSAFENGDLMINCDVGGGPYELVDGVCFYAEGGDGYQTAPCLWQVTKQDDNVHDGLREIAFDAVCYIPAESIPYFEQDFQTVLSSELYDYYTGMWLTASSAYDDTERGENHYLHTVSWNGTDYEIEFFYSTQWEDTADGGRLFTKSYIVYVPEDYDGLIFAAEPQPATYDETDARLDLDRICPEASILAIDLIDPEHFLFFDLCA